MALDPNSSPVLLDELQSFLDPADLLLPLDPTMDVEQKLVLPSDVEPPGKDTKLL